MKTSTIKNTAGLLSLAALIALCFAFSKEKPDNKDYVGKYKMNVDPSIIVTILEENGKLLSQITLDGDQKYEMLPSKSEKNTFETSDKGKPLNKIVFYRNKLNKVTYLILIQGGQYRADKI